MSLHDKCILVDLTIRSVTTARTDPAITRSVNRDLGAQDDAGRWVTRLWPKEALDPISKHDSATSRYHRDMTLPWLDNSKRILPSARFLPYMEEIRARKAARTSLVADFISRYDHWVHEAAAMRGTAFSLSDYPDRSTAAAAFDFRVESEPVPHKDDFRVSLSATDMAEMQDILEERLAAGAKIVRNDLIRRISSPLAHMVERLSEPGAAFRDSLFSNIREIVDLIPALNVTDDPDIETIRLQITARLRDLDPSTVRDSAFERSRTARAAANILSTMAPWLEDADPATAAAA